MRNSMKMIAYMLLIGSHESDLAAMKNNYFEMKKLLFRKIIENICHLMG